MLLDNCLDRKLSRSISGHTVEIAAEIGWGDLKNGALLAAAAGRFDAVLTIDKNIRFQQHLPALPVPVVQFDAVSNWVGDLLPFLPYLDLALDQTKRFNLVVVRKDGRLECYGDRSTPGG